MLKTIISIYIFITPIITVIGQSKLKPLDPNITDLSLVKFIEDLNLAVENKDEAFILSHLDTEIMNSFGGNGGIEEFKDYWSWNSGETGFWLVMKKILSLGGGKYVEGVSYSMPYVFSDWPENTNYDPYTYMAITGSNVNVRDTPSLTDSQVLGQFTYDIVKVDYDKSYPSYEQHKKERKTGLYNDVIGYKRWFYSESVDGNLKGYVYRDFIWSPIGYRIGFYKIEGEWKITSLLAGD